MEGVQTVDVSWLHHSQKGQCPVSDAGPSSHPRAEDSGRVGRTNTF
jgi:hypothetical protein